MVHLHLYSTGADLHYPLIIKDVSQSYRHFPEQENHLFVDMK